MKPEGEEAMSERGYICNVSCYLTYGNRPGFPQACPRCSAGTRRMSSHYCDGRDFNEYRCGSAFLWKHATKRRGVWRFVQKCVVAATEPTQEKRRAPCDI